jgi:anti-sigma regulatory factor (Ser/Thr protein kinase)
LGYLAENLKNLVQDDFFDLKIILSELLFNAVIHGCQTSASKRAYINVRLDGLTVHAKIRDEGVGFDYRAVLSEARDSRSEHGRGVSLAAGLADCFSYNEAGNEITIQKKLGR